MGKVEVYAGHQPACITEDPIVSAGTNSESHQLEAQLGATRLMRIRRAIGHPSRLASCPPVSSPYGPQVHSWCHTRPSHIEP
eukprot:1161679-Pelagomonas_calceolata.AAC.3